MLKVAKAMKYSHVLIVCLIIHAIISVDIFRKKSSAVLPAVKSYRVFVLSMGLYFLSDLLWGVFEENKLAIPLFIDTCVYFLLMGFSILAWARYAVQFLQAEKKIVGRILLYYGNAFFLAEVILIIVNIFHPILFDVDMQTCEYIALQARDIMLYLQILMYALLFLYTLIFTIVNHKGNSFNRKYIIVSFYSVAMSTAVSVQIYFPNLPLYSMGCVIGVTMLNSFLINDIKEEYRSALERSQMEVTQGKIALSQTMLIAYSDPLTGIKNKHAYVEEEERIDKLIGAGQMEDFAVIVFDLNGLKLINDTKGHDAGDAYIIEAVKTIERFFEGETLYRFGGDEFVLILEGEGFKNRQKMLSEFESFIDGCLGQEGAPIISSGMSRYRHGQDNTYHAVFNRADKIMYARKDTLKEHHSA